MGFYSVLIGVLILSFVACFIVPFIYFMKAGIKINGRLIFSVLGAGVFNFIAPVIYIFLMTSAFGPGGEPFGNESIFILCGILFFFLIALGGYMIIMNVNKNAELKEIKYVIAAELPANIFLWIFITNALRGAWA
ncbi:MAG: hypothetical protein FWC57_01005 [Endomicrobia bacterium]|nr:hypothetical protein [Endomicrobiia bacterium]